jgi:hypothetical protein
MTQQRKADPPTMAEILEWATIQHNAVAERARTAVAAEKVHKTKAAERNALAVVRELVVIRGSLDFIKLSARATPEPRSCDKTVVGDTWYFPTKTS